MANGKGYRLVIVEYDANWKEQERELGKGAILSQGKLLFDGWKKKAGPRTIKLVLYDGSGNVEDEYER